MSQSDPAAPPVPVPAAPPESWLRRVAADTLYSLTAFPLAWAGMVAAVTGLCVGLSTVVLVVGLPILVGTLLTCRWFAQVERSRIRSRGRAMTTPVYLRASDADPWWRQQVARLRDLQAWLDVAWALVFAPIAATVAFTIVLAWWVVAGAGLTYWAWQHWLPATDGETFASLIGLGSGRGAETALNLVWGLLAALTMAPVMRAVASGLAAVNAQFLDALPDLQGELRTAVGQRAAAQEAEVASLRRLERDLHDGPQQSLVRLGMDLGRARRMVAQDPARAEAILDEAIDRSRETVTELRALSRSIAPPLLVDRGLGVALEELAARHQGRVQTLVDLPQPLSPAVETALFFTVSEALTNVAKHAQATDVWVQAGRVGDVLEVRVRDNGVGGAHLAKGSGLAGLAQRLSAVGGVLEVASPDGGPTTVTARIPWSACVS